MQIKQFPAVTIIVICRHNGAYKPTEGLMEQVLMDKLLGFLKQRQADDKAFFTYYAPFSIHKR
jgi:hypothetical protein